MPFKLKLKKSRQYNVTSKSLFVISVHHLLVLETPTTVDCTLSSDNTGQDCLDNVCQRLSINQTEFFGLRYVVKGTDDELRWVDLERPLSRQLDKYAAGSRLYLRVMYYVISGVSLINDEVARNYYFLQLKSDLVEGKMSCDAKQAVVLAVYSRQAQYESNQTERHTVDYLKTLLPFPRQLIEAGLLETLTEEVLLSNSDIQSLTQSAAEDMFIAACQQLDGYGQEKFHAKDDSNIEVILGVTVSGIAVASNDLQKFYPWHDIRNVVNHKRTFNIDCTMPEKNVGFTLQDANSARYFWRLCVLQHTFYMKYEQNQMHNTTIEQQQQQHNIFQNQPDDLCESKDNLFMIDNGHHQQHLSSSNNLYASDSYIASTTNSNWHHQQQQQQDSCVSSNMSLATGNNQQLRSMSQQNWPLPATLSNNDLNRNGGTNWQTTPVITGNIISDSNSTLSNRVQSSSCLDLSNNNISTDRERLKAFLPGYRPAPDYETAVQQKYRTSETELRMNASSMNHIQSSGGINMYTGSQPDVHRSSIAVTDEIYGEQLLQHKYPDVTQTANSVYQQQQQQFDMKLLGLSQQLQMMKFNRTISPYAGVANRLSSTSTPDLALASHRALLGGYHRGAAYVSGSSPDLVSTRTFLNPHLIVGNNILTQHQLQQQQHQHQLPHHLIPTMQQSAGNANTFRYRFSQSHLPHGTYENLNFVDAQTKTNLLSQKLQKAYEDAYRTKPLPNHNNNGNSGGGGGMIKHQHTGSIEPIYENVPLPRPDSATVQPQQLNEMRDRASSMQSTPGVIRYKQPPLYHAADTNNFNVSTTSMPPLSSDNNSQQTLYTEPAAGHRVIVKSSSSNSTSSIGGGGIVKPPTVPQQESTSTKINTISAAAIKAIQSFESTQFHQQSSASATHMNRSMSSNVLDSSHNSSSYTTTTTDSGISLGTKEKKKRRWGGFFGGSKSSLNDKQKSATLGRDRNRNDKSTTSLSSSSMQRNDELNFRHRWSTGLQRIPLPASISKEKLCQILETKLSDQQLYIEFEQIPKRRESARYECALHDENRLRNFDPNFLPYDDNRVRITPTRENRMGYYNASHITATVGAKQRFYIVAQSPNSPQALTMFLQCVWEADVYLLVQLTDDIDYVPPTANKCFEYGQYQVWQEFSQVTDRCVTSKLRIYHSQSKRYRSVWHLKYSEWAEQNCPKDVGHFLEFLEELSGVQSASINEVPPGHNTNPPVLIHCSEGGGRSGVTLAADLLLYTMDHNQDLDIPRVVSQLRHQRDNIVPSLAQYKFVYALLIHYLKRTRLI